MKTIKILSISIILVLFITSCDRYGTTTVIGSGDVETMEVSLADFTGVSVTGTCDVDIQIGDIQSVELSAQSQILDVMTYEVKDGILNIGFKRGTTVENSKEISADIVVPALSYIAVTGAGDFKLDGAKQEFLDIYITGTGDVNAFNLEVDDCMVKISGAGMCELNVIESLDVQISGVGNIFYTGHPSLTSDISGVGNVIAVEQ
jgi:hypothetical protein